MRFRLGEDERRYLTLRSEVYLRLLPHLPQQTLVEVMRNLGKMEAMAYGEGIKQGMVVAASSADAEVMPPIVAHADFYGDAQTPLVRVEEKMLPKKREDHPWLVALPVEFPPQTLAEALAAYGPTLEAAPETQQRRATPEQMSARKRALVEALEHNNAPSNEAVDAVKREWSPARIEEDGFGLPEDMVVQIGKTIDISDHAEEDRDELAARVDEAAAPDSDMGSVESPDLLDRIRTQIQQEQKNGWEPKTWPDVILRLMTSMQIDASFLDLQLGGEQGRAVLDQCGLPNIFPGGGVIVDAEGKFAGVRT